MSTNILQFSVRASARSFTVPIVGIGLIVISGLKLLGVVRSGLVELLGLGAKEITSECSEDGSLSMSSEGGGIGAGFSLVSL